MGSFNVGCAITDGMIFEGEVVYLIPIQKQSYVKTKGEITYKDKKYNDINFDDRPVYFDDNWKIVAQPFKAVYADYGLFEVDDNVALKSFYSFLEENGTSITVGENEYHDTPFNLEDFKKEKNEENKFKMVMEAIREQRLFAFNVVGSFLKRQEITEIQFAVVKSTVIKNFLKIYEESLELSSEISKLENETELTNDSKERLKELYEISKNHPIGDLWNVKYILQKIELLKFIEKIANKEFLNEEDLEEIFEMLEKHQHLISNDFHELSFAYYKKALLNSKEMDKNTLIKYILKDFQTSYMRNNPLKNIIEQLFSYTGKELCPVVYKGQDDNYFNTLHYLVQKEFERNQRMKEENDF